MTEVTFRGRHNTLCALDVWMRKDSWQAQGIVCGRGEYRCHSGRVSGYCLEGLDSQNCLAGLRDLEEVSYEMLVLQTLTCEFWRKSRTKRSFWRLGT